MKKALISALAAVAIMGCSESATDDAAAYGGEAGTGSYVEHICIGAAASSDDTRAAYDDNLDTIEKTGDHYEYRFEVAPVSVEGLTITLVDTEGSEITRTVGAKTFTANHRTGFNIYWDSVSIAMDEATSWYERYATDTQTDLAMGTIFVNGVHVRGVGASQISKVGIEINGTFYQTTPATDYDMAIGSFASGEYAVNAYVQFAGGKELRTETRTVHVTATLPAIASHYIRSSYNTNGTTAMTNDLDGSRIYANVVLNDPYVQSSLVSSTTLYCGSASQQGTAGSEFTTGDLAYGRYDNCHVTVVLGNGYTIDTPAYTVNVTGIPYYLDPDSASPAGWSTSNTSEWSGHIRFNTTDAYAISPTFFVPEPFNVNASISAYAYGGTIYGNYKPAVYISASSSGIASGEATTLSGSNLLPNAGASYHDISRTLGLGSVNNVCIFTSGKKGSSWTIGTNGVVVRSISITY